MFGSGIVLKSNKERKEAGKMWGRIFVLALGLILGLGQVMPAFCNITTGSDGLPAIGATRSTAAGGVFVYRKGVLLQQRDFLNGTDTFFAGGERIKVTQYAPIDLLTVQPIVLQNLNTRRGQPKTVTLEGYSIADLMDAQLGGELANKIAQLMGFDGSRRVGSLTFDMLTAIKDQVGAGLTNFPAFRAGNSVDTIFEYKDGQLVGQKTAVLDKNGDVVRDGAGNILYDTVTFNHGVKVSEKSYKPKADGANHDEGFEATTSYFKNGQLIYEVVENIAKEGTAFNSKGITSVRVFDGLGREIAEYGSADPSRDILIPDVNGDGKITTEEVAAALENEAVTRLKSETFYEGNSLRKTRSIEYAYDPDTGEVDLNKSRTTFFEYDEDGRLSKEMSYLGNFTSLAAMTDAQKANPVNIKEYHYNRLGGLSFIDEDERGERPEQKRTYFQWNRPLVWFSRTPPRDAAPNSTSTPNNTSNAPIGSIVATDAAGNRISYSGRSDWVIVIDDNGNMNLVVDRNQTAIAFGPTTPAGNYDFYQAAAVIALMRAGKLTGHNDANGQWVWDQANAAELISTARDKIIVRNHTEAEAWKVTRGTYEGFKIIVTAADIA